MPGMSQRLPRLTAVFLAAGLFAAACGDDGGATADAPPDDDATTTTTTTTTTVAPATTTPSEEDPTMTTTTTDATPPPIDVGGEADAANVDEMLAFLNAPGEDGPFYMVNLLRHRDVAVYADGRETDLTGEEADAIYGEFMRNTKLPEIGAEIVYIGIVEQDLIGGTEFDQVAVVKYPSRAAFQAMTESADFQEMSVHKQAGVADTVVMATSLISAPGVPPLDDPPFPATGDDRPFTFMHVLDYRETARYAPGDEDADDTRPGSEAVDIYSGNAGEVAVPLGVRPLAWFQVEATVIGPVDQWEEVRINWFPSHATFTALTSDPEWQEGSHHRTAGLEQTYAIMNEPVINAFLPDSE